MEAIVIDPAGTGILKLPPTHSSYQVSTEVMMRTCALFQTVFSSTDIVYIGKTEDPLAIGIVLEILHGLPARIPKDSLTPRILAKIADVVAKWGCLEHLGDYPETWIAEVRPKAGEDFEPYEPWLRIARGFHRRDIEKSIVEKYAKQWFREFGVPQLEKLKRLIDEKVYDMICASRISAICHIGKTISLYLDVLYQKEQFCQAPDPDEQNVYCSALLMGSFIRLILYSVLRPIPMKPFGDITIQGLLGTNGLGKNSILGLPTHVNCICHINNMRDSLSDTIKQEISKIEAKLDSAVKAKVAGFGAMRDLAETGDFSATLNRKPVEDEHTGPADKPVHTGDIEIATKELESDLHLKDMEARSRKETVLNFTPKDSLGTSKDPGLKINQGALQSMKLESEHSKSDRKHEMIAKLPELSKHAMELSAFDEIPESAEGVENLRERLEAIGEIRSVLTSILIPTTASDLSKTGMENSPLNGKPADQQKPEMIFETSKVKGEIQSAEKIESSTPGKVEHTAQTQNSRCTAELEVPKIVPPEEFTADTHISKTTIPGASAEHTALGTNSAAGAKSPKVPHPIIDQIHMIVKTVKGTAKYPTLQPTTPPVMKDEQDIQGDQESDRHQAWMNLRAAWMAKTEAEKHAADARATEEKAAEIPQPPNRVLDAEVNSKEPINTSLDVRAEVQMVTPSVISVMQSNEEPSSNVKPSTKTATVARDSFAQNPQPVQPATNSGQKGENGFITPASGSNTVRGRSNNRQAISSRFNPLASSFSPSPSSRPEAGVLKVMLSGAENVAPQRREEKPATPGRTLKADPTTLVEKSKAEPVIATRTTKASSALQTTAKTATSNKADPVDPIRTAIARTNRAEAGISKGEPVTPVRTIQDKADNPFRKVKAEPITPKVKAEPISPVDKTQLQAGTASHKTATTTQVTLEWTVEQRWKIMHSLEDPVTKSVIKYLRSKYREVDASLILDVAYKNNWSISDADRVLLEIRSQIRRSAPPASGAPNKS